MKRVLVVLLALMAGFVAPAPIAVAEPAALAITGASNFRDVAGDGIVTKTGHMATGVIYRSARLYDLNASDIAQLETLGITDIYDLRTGTAAKAAPDKAVAGATNHQISLFAGHSLTGKPATTAAGARAYMRKLNTRFVTVSAQRKALAKVLHGIAVAKGAVIIHCTAGKDRTGWVSAMLQYIAGANDSRIVAQYLLSNDYRADEIAQAVATALAKHGKRASEVVYEKEHLRPSYLQAGMAKARATYGSLKRYLTKGVGLSAADYAALQLKLHTA